MSVCADLPDRVDVGVVGSDLAAVATALLLARGGASVAWIDDAEPVLARPEPADLGVVEHPHRTIHALGEAGARALFGFADGGRDLWRAEGLLVDEGTLWAATEAREPDAFADARRVLAAIGRRAELLDADATDARAGGHGFTGGLWLADGGRLRPDARDVLVRRAVAAGVWHVRGQATLDPDAGPVRMGLPGGQLLCELVVIARPALDPRIEAAVMPVRETAVALACPELPTIGGRAGQGWTHWSPVDGALWVSGARWATPHLEVGETDPTPDPRVLGRLEAFGAQRFGCGPVIRAWAWGFWQSRDQLPVIGPVPGSGRRIALVGMGPNPATWAFAAARAVADGILGDAEPVPDPLSSRRLVRWSG